MLSKTATMMNANLATAIGLGAIVLWSTCIGLIRSVSESFGAVAGAALMYSFASVILVLTLGLPKIKQMPTTYLRWGSVLFVVYELCFSLSIGYAHNAQQAIEVGMINYLWPTFTLLFAMMFNQMKANWLIVPGSILALFGIVWILAGEQGLALTQIWHNLQDNPLSYALALFGAIIWAGYCSLTVRTSKGHNGVSLFFILVSVVLWLKYFYLGAPALHFNAQNIVVLALAATALGFGYVAWNVGIVHGKMNILAGASYFTPVLSALLAMLLLDANLSLAFWQGTAMVTLGAILSWISTQTAKS